MESYPLDSSGWLPLGKEERAWDTKNRGFQFTCSVFSCIKTWYDNKTFPFIKLGWKVHGYLYVIPCSSLSFSFFKIIFQSL